MATIESIFGAYTSKLQVMIDDANDQFAPVWFPRYFTWDAPKTQLTFETVIGRSRLNPAASMIARGSRAPLRARPGMEKVTGSIPQMAEKFKMDENDYREFLALQSMNVSEETKFNQIMDMMFNDVKNVGDSAMKRLDYMALEAVSTGKLTLTLSNNPDGTQQLIALDLLFPTENQTNAAVSWNNPTTAKPITDIITVVNLHRPKGNRFAKILMTWETWNKFIVTTEVQNVYTAYVGKINQIMRPTLENINSYMSSQGLPAIEIVDEVIAIEKDGVTTPQYPFKTENAAFIPAGNLGVIHNAISIEELRPVQAVTYAKYNRALISKFAENEPFYEYTKVELNAIPGVSVADSIHLLSTTASFP